MAEAKKNLFSLVALCLMIGHVFSICNLLVYSESRSKFDDYMGGVNHFIRHVTRSRMDCDRKCAMSMKCKSYTFDNATQECHLLNFTLTNTEGLSERPGAKYFARIKALPGTFTCPSQVGPWYSVAGHDGCINVRPVHTLSNYDQAVTGCATDGGRLFVMNNLIKRQLFMNLTNCPGFSKYYLTDGRNDNATDYYAEDAFRTSYGQVVPLWAWGYDQYHPATEHCLFMHNWNGEDHYHTISCSSSIYYLCERDY